MMIDLKRLHTNQRLLVAELLSRGAEVLPVDYEREVMEVRYDGRKEYLIDRTSARAAHVPAVLASDKHLTKKILSEAGIRVPQGGIFGVDEMAAAVSMAESIGYPVVFKPNFGSHGKFVRSDIRNEKDIRRAALSFFDQSHESERFIIERHIPGAEHRVFMTANGDYAVLRREPAHVIGDGESDIEALARIETEKRAEVKRKQGSALCPVAYDTDVEDYLHERGIRTDYIPQTGEKIYLRRISNVALGGTTRDMTLAAHSSVVDIASRALACFEGLGVIGIDLVTPDITQDQRMLNHAVIEVNANPGLSMHAMPAEGEAQPVARYVADVMFPDLAV